jgi:arylsulfatase A-like enzyme
VARSPNVVVLLCDQERAAPSYEDTPLRQFRLDRLPARRWLAENGVDFARHYTGATACSPSRPTLLTGQYPSLHSVTQTSGIAKHHGDPRLRWLLPRDVPTLGDYFRAAGYETVYKGKWHVSDADLRDGDGNVVRTVRSDGRRLPAGEQAYAAANALDEFGFAGWIGPEPHGALLADSGLRRDPVIAEQAVDWIRTRGERARRGDAEASRPFLLVASFVNPHDVCLWPAWSVRPPAPLADDDVPVVGPAPSADESLDDKPTAQRRYREAYMRMYGPKPLIENVYAQHQELYRRNYHHLLHLVDREMARTLDAIRQSPFFEETVLVFTSDHGELLGAHGLHQKWFNMYEETVHVPFVVSHAGGLGPVGRRVEDTLTSHVDLLPTLLGLAGFDAAALGERLQATHGEVHPLVGRDLSPIVRGEPAPAGPSVVYFATEDRVLEGDTQVAAIGQRLPRLGNLFSLNYDSVHDCAASIEGIVASVRGTGLPQADGRVFKLVRYFDDPALWSEPGVRDRYRHQAGPRAGEIEERREPHPEEWELYDLGDDPAELRNRAGRVEDARLFTHLRELLASERARKRLERRQPRPYATVAPLPPPHRPWVDLSRLPWLLEPLSRLVRGR